MKKNKYIKVMNSASENWSIEKPSNINNVIDGWIDGDTECKNIYTLSLVEMTEEEYNKLPEFTGW